MCLYAMKLFLSDPQIATLLAMEAAGMIIVVLGMMMIPPKR